MKRTVKSVIQITGIIVCITLLYFNLSLNGKSNAINTNLSALVKTSEANAECIPPNPNTILAGKCNEGYDICYYALGYECDVAY